MDPNDVKTVEDLVTFVRALIGEGANAENRQTVDYLEALAAWVEDSWSVGAEPMHGLTRPDAASWSLVAAMLQAALMYE